VGRLAQFRQRYRHQSGTFKLSGTTESFKPETIRATGSGRVNSGGTVTASNIQLAGGRWQGHCSGIQLGRILPQLPPQLQGRLNGRFNLSGGLAAITRKHGAGGSLQVADGTVTATNVTLRDGRWQGSLLPIELRCDLLPSFRR